MSREAPKAGGEEFAANGDGRFSPNRRSGLRFELVFLRVGTTEDGKAQTEHGDNGNDFKNGHGAHVVEQQKVLSAVNRGRNTEDGLGMLDTVECSACTFCAS